MMRQLKIGQKITTREATSLDKYLNEIGKVKLLTPEDEIILARKIRAGDQVALERLIKCNLRFVVSVAKNYQNFGLSLGDLINEGNLGLIKASSSFDETRGFKFISYAIWPIRQSIFFAITDQVRTIRLPQNMVGSLSKINKIIKNLQQELERNPSISEISQRIEMDEDKIKECLENAKLSISLNAVVDEDKGFTFLDTLKNDTPDTDSHLIDESISHQVNIVLKSLSKREKEVIKLYYGIGYPEPLKLEDIADLFQLSKERIRQIKDKALKKLKHRKTLLSNRIINI